MPWPWYIFQVTPLTSVDPLQLARFKIVYHLGPHCLGFPNDHSVHKAQCFVGAHRSMDATQHHRRTSLAVDGSDFISTIG